jgi:hypothetical protein
MPNCANTVAHRISFSTVKFKGRRSMPEYVCQRNGSLAVVELTAVTGLTALRGSICQGFKEGFGTGGGRTGPWCSLPW